MIDFDRLLPPRFDNDYRGHPLALWAFVPITVMTLGRSLVHIFRADGGAQSIATIPLDAMTENGAAAVVSIFALWGLSQVLLGIVYGVALLRYRSMIPLFYALLFVEYAGRLLLSTWKPIETLSAPPGATGNLIFIVLTPVLLALSLRSSHEAEARGTA